VDSRLRRSPPDRASAVPYGQAGENALRFPHLAHRSAAAHKLHSATANEDLFRVLDGFPDLAHHDEVDACSGALEMLNPHMKSWGHYEWMRRRAQELEEQRAAAAPVFWTVG
jgi:hypothetical protein